MPTGFVMSVRLPHESARLPLDGFSWNVISGTFTKVCRANTDVVKIEQKYWALYMFNIADSDTYSPTAVLPCQQWLRERATVLLLALLPSS